MILHYTFDDFQEPTVNLIPGGSKNSYPSIGNTHGTFNTNQYNNNTYFSIGTISKIEDNIVTLANIGHPIYTYDVLTPQTSGGGVVAGQHYFVKKISNNTFSLHPYNTNQDGSLGFAVHDSIKNDIRIPITNSNFPTSWYGAPHNPNSALIKEIIPNCFSSLDNNVHDCIRLHTDHKPEGDIDYMAYGVLPNLTANTTYTFSFYYRAVDNNSIGTRISFRVHTPGTTWLISITLPATNEWQRHVITGKSPNTGNSFLYFEPIKRSKIDISEIQIEQKDYVTPFTVEQREGLAKDYSGNNNTSELGLNDTPKWDEGTYIFDGVKNTIISKEQNSIEGSQTYFAWIKINNGNGLSGIVSNHNHSNTSNLGLNLNDRRLSVSIGYTDNTREYNTKYSTKQLNLNEWIMVAMVYNTENNKIHFYVNGEIDSSYTVTKTIKYTPNKISVGRWTATYSGYYFNGNIDDVRVYNRALSDKEIELIYNESKDKY